MFLQPDTWLGSLYKLFFLLNVATDQHLRNTTRSGDGVCQLPSYTNGLASWETKPYTILVEGTAGCGKSTLVDILASQHRLMAIPEPVDQWVDVNGTDLLDLMFQDPKRWTGAFQMESTLTRIKAAIQKPVVKGRPALVRVMERSLYSERYIFLEHNKQSGMMTEAEFNLMDLWHKFAMEQFESKMKPDLIIFLKTDMETVEKRIKKRGRIEERNMDLGFVDAINRLHEDWLLHQNSSFPVPAPVLVMNGTLGLDGFKTYVKDEMMQKIIPADQHQYILN